MRHRPQPTTPLPPPPGICCPPPGFGPAEALTLPTPTPWYANQLLASCSVGLEALTLCSADELVNLVAISPEEAQRVVGVEAAPRAPDTPEGDLLFSGSGDTTLTAAQVEEVMGYPPDKFQVGRTPHRPHALSLRTGGREEIRRRLHPQAPFWTRGRQSCPSFAMTTSSGTS